MHGEVTQRLELPAARAVAHPRCPGEVGGAPQDQIAQRAAGEVGGGHPGPDVPAGEAEAGPGVVGHRRGPIPRHPEHARPGMVDRGRVQGREEPAQQCGETVDGRRLGAAVGVHGGAVTVRNAATTECDAPVGGPLGVHVHVRHIAECVVTLPVDRLPGGLRQRFGDDHRGVHR